jgi:hypothetical protein
MIELDRLSLISKVVRSRVRLSGIISSERLSINWSHQVRSDWIGQIEGIWFYEKKYQLNRVRNTEYLKSLSYSSILPPLYFTKRALHDCSKVASRQAVLHHDSQVCFNDNDERVKLSLSSDIESDKQSMWPGCMHTSIQRTNQLQSICWDFTMVWKFVLSHITYSMNDTQWIPEPTTKLSRYKYILVCLMHMGLKP